MKNILMIFVTLACLPTFAQEFYTTDKLNYVIALDYQLSGTQAKSCAKKICKLALKEGSQDCTFLKAIGVVNVSLSHYAAAKVDRMSCVSEILESEVVEAHPRVGREN